MKSGARHALRVREIQTELWWRCQSFPACKQGELVRHQRIFCLPSAMLQRNSYYIEHSPSGKSAQQGEKCRSSAGGPGCNQRSEEMSFSRQERACDNCSERWGIERRTTPTVTSAELPSRGLDANYKGSIRGTRQLLPLLGTFQKLCSSSPHPRIVLCNSGQRTELENPGSYCRKAGSTEGAPFCQS